MKAQAVNWWWWILQRVTVFNHIKELKISWKHSQPKHNQIIKSLKTDNTKLDDLKEIPYHLYQWLKYTIRRAKLILTFNNTAANYLGGEFNYTTTSEPSVFKSSSSHFKRVDNYMIIPTVFPIFSHFFYAIFSRLWSPNFEAVEFPSVTIGSTIMISCQFLINYEWSSPWVNRVEDRPNACVIIHVQIGESLNQFWKHTLLRTRLMIP